MCWRHVKPMGKSLPPSPWCVLLQDCYYICEVEIQQVATFLVKRIPTVQDYEELGTQLCISHVLMEHAEVITREEEKQLWDSGVMGINNPRALANAVFLQTGRTSVYRVFLRPFSTRLNIQSTCMRGR